MSDLKGKMKYNPSIHPKESMIRAQALEEGLENMDVRINKAGKQNHAFGIDFLKGLDIIRRIARPEPWEQEYKN